MLMLLFSGQRSKETQSLGQLSINPVRYMVLLQPEGQTVMTGLVIQLLLIAAQQQSDSSVC